MAASLTTATTSILIVDDQIENIQVLASLLSRHGYRVRKATSARMALRSMVAEMPDLVLLDVRMPTMDGYDLCAEMKQSSAMSKIPILFLSAMDSLEDRLRGFDVGGADFIAKPFQSEEVLARVAYQLKLLHQQRQLEAQNQQLQAQERRIQQQYQLQRLLFSVLEHVHRSLDLPDILMATVREVRTLLSAERVTICRFESEHQTLKLLAKADSQVDWVYHTEADSITCEGVYASFVQAEADLVQTVDLCLTQSVCPPGFQYDPSQTCLAVLLKPQEKLWGLMIVLFPEAAQPLYDGARAMLEQLSMPIAIAIHQAEMHQQLTLANKELLRLNITDGLTQIFNRTYCNEQLPRDWRRAERSQEPIAVLLADIDHFKAYNDTYGHLEGDHCLRQIAGVLQSVLRRPGDWVARYGGEEFVMVLPQTEITGAKLVAEHIQAAIRALAISNIGAPNDFHLVSLSIGVASCIPTLSGAGFEMLLENADRALYRAKASGRDRIEVFEEGLPMLNPHRDDKAIHGNPGSP